MVVVVKFNGDIFEQWFVVKLYGNVVGYQYGDILKKEYEGCDIVDIMLVNDIFFMVCGKFYCGVCVKVFVR